jgi:hypothetical protein
LVRADGTADRGTASRAKARSMAIARRRAQGEAKRRSNCSGAYRPIVGRFRTACDLAVRIVLAHILIVLKHLERLIGRGKGPYGRTTRVHGASGKERCRAYTGNHNYKFTHQQLLYRGRDVGRRLEGPPILSRYLRTLSHKQAEPKMNCA